MEIDVVYTTPFEECSEQQVKQLIEAASSVIEIPQDYSFSIVFVGNSRIQELNAQYRGKDYATDVLSFPYDDESGEIVISVDKIREQAKEFGHSTQIEACFMVVHGVLHVMGWDHERSEEEDREQRELEHTILKKCNIEPAR